MSIPLHSDFREVDGRRRQINSGKPVLFDFWATWCGPCRMISPIFETLSEKIKDVEFYKVDVDAAPAISEEVGIKAVGPNHRNEWMELNMLRDAPHRCLPLHFSRMGTKKASWLVLFLRNLKYAPLIPVSIWFIRLQLSNLRSWSRRP
jgi:thiol-disulfide isomerase/thioredoxin